MMTDNTRPNPYVGPRAFKTGERLYGRDQEVRELLNLLIAERIVLLHSPSGAGKSSLVQAGLLPRLKEKRFSILPVVRVNHEPPAALKGADTFNRYAYSVMLSLETALEPDQRTAEAELASLTLDEYLKNYQGPNHDGSSGDDPAEGDGFNPLVQSQVLIFDQFEEVLTADSTDRDAKLDFFSQLGLALRERSRWALFAMREDYLPALDPYLIPVPTRLANTYRLDFLSADAAHLAIHQPAGECGVDFTEDAVTKLVNDLRQVQVQQPDGSMELRLGTYVEPVQLQVVCYNLWQHLAPNQVKIAEEDISGIGTVDESLAEYYAEQVALVSNQTGVRERLIREWFNNRLVTESGLRGQVLMEQGQSSGLSNDAIHLLEDSHLVRAEKRLGGTWFELAHDRLIQPVRKNNAAWFYSHLSLLQRQATLWENENRSDTLYLRDAALEDAEAWARENADELSPIDKEFLENCLQLRAVERAAFEAAERERQLKLEAAQQLAEAEKLRAEEQARAAARLRRRAFILAGVLVLAIVMAGLAFVSQRAARASALEALRQKQVAEAASTLAVNNAQIADANAATAQAAGELADRNAVRAQENAATAEAASIVALAQQATAEYNAQVAKENEEIARTQANLARSRELASIALTFLKQNTSLSLLLGKEALDISNTGQGLDALLRGLQRNLDRQAEKYDQFIPRQEVDIYTIAASPDGKKLVWGGSDGVIRAWDLDSQSKSWERFFNRGFTVRSLSFWPDGKVVAAADSSGQITLLNAENGRKVIDLPSSLLEVNAIAVSPDGTKLAYGGKSEGRNINLFVRDMQTSQVQGFRIKQGEVADVFDLAWSPDGKLLASAGPDRMVHVWDSATGVEVQTLKTILRDNVPYNVYEGPIRSLAFSPNGKWLATGGDDNESGAKDRTLLLWDTFAWTDQEPVVLTGPNYDLTALSFSPDGGTLASAYDNGEIALWNVNSQTLNGSIKDHSREVKALDFSQFGKSLLLVSSGLDRTIVMNNLIAMSSLDSLLTEGKGNPVRLAVNQNDDLVIAGTADGQVAAWEIDGGNGQENPLEMGANLTSGQFFLSTDGQSLASLPGDGQIAVHQLTSGDVLTLTVPNMMVNTLDATGAATTGDAPGAPDAVGFSQDGTTLAAGMCSQRQVSVTPDGEEIDDCIENEIILWDIASGELLKRIHTGLPSAILSLAFHPEDVNSIASGFEDGSIRLWDLDQGRMSGLPMVGLGGPVTSLAYHADGDVLASGGANKLIALWNLQPPQLLGDPIAGSDGAITGLAFSPSTSVLFSGTDKGTVTRLDIESWKSLACKLADRNLIRAEWEQFFPDMEYRATCEMLSLDEPTPTPAPAESTPTPTPSSGTPAPTPTP